MFGQIIASNFKLEPNDPKDFNIPWQERVLSVKLFIDNSEIYFHTTHIPPGSGNGWIKIETLEGIYERLKENKDNLNISIFSELLTLSFILETFFNPVSIIQSEEIILANGSKTH